MAEHKIFTTAFAVVYPLYIAKLARKGRTQAELDTVICWLTGYDAAGLQSQIQAKTDFKTFFAQAPAMHPNCALITGLVCGIRVEEVSDPLMQKIRQMDKLVDELAKGRVMEKVLRQNPVTKDNTLSRKPTTWDGFIDAVRVADVPADFLDVAEREHGNSQPKRRSIGDRRSGI